MLKVAHKLPRINVGGRLRHTVGALGVLGVLAAPALGASPHVLAASPHLSGASNVVEPTPNPAGATQSDLNGVSCRSATVCTAVGSYFSKLRSEQMLAEQWNGVRWTIRATPNPPGAATSHLDAVSCAAANSCMAVGGFRYPVGLDVPLAEHFNGTSWRPVVPQIPSGAIYSFLNGVSCPAANDCYAVGTYLAGGTGGIDLPLIEHWNGRAWAIQPATDPSGSEGSGLSSVSCPTATACLAVGDWENGGHEYTFAERLFGTSWEDEFPANQTFSYNVLNSVSCTRAMVCAAVGWYADPITGFYKSLGEISNSPARWNINFMPSPGLTHSYLASVSCTSATNCTAVGHFDLFNGIESTFGAFYNGATWASGTTPTVPFENTYVFGSSAVSCPAVKVCTIVGDYKNSSGTYVTFAGQGA